MYGLMSKHGLSLLGAFADLIFLGSDKHEERIMIRAIHFVLCKADRNDFAVRG